MFNFIHSTTMNQNLLNKNEKASFNNNKYKNKQDDKSEEFESQLQPILDEQNAEYFKEAIEQLEKYYGKPWDFGTAAIGTLKINHNGKKVTLLQYVLQWQSPLSNNQKAICRCLFTALGQHLLAGDIDADPLKLACKNSNADMVELLIPSYIQNQKDIIYKADIDDGNALGNDTTTEPKPLDKTQIDNMNTRIIAAIHATSLSGILDIIEAKSTPSKGMLSPSMAKLKISKDHNETYRNIFDVVIKAQRLKIESENDIYSNNNSNNPDEKELPTNKLQQEQLEQKQQQLNEDILALNEWSLPRDPLMDACKKGDKDRVISLIPLYADLLNTDTPKASQRIFKAIAKTKDLETLECIKANELAGKNEKYLEAFQRAIAMQKTALGTIDDKESDKNETQPTFFKTGAILGGCIGIALIGLLVGTSFLADYCTHEYSSKGVGEFKADTMFNRAAEWMWCGVLGNEHCNPNHYHDQRAPLAGMLAFSASVFTFACAAAGAWKVNNIMKPKNG